MPRDVLPLLFGRQSEKLWLHVNLAQTGNAAGELEQCLNAFQDTHVRESDLLFRCQPLLPALPENPRTLINSNFACSLNVSIVFVTLNMVLMMS
jgi:hypothetical protein